MRRTTVLAAAVLATAVLSGCATTVQTAAVTVAAPGPATTGRPIPAAPKRPAPALANTGTNWPVIVASITAYGQWLLANPNPALVATIAVPGCGAFNALTAETQSLVEQNAYVKTSPPVFTSVTGLATTSNVSVDIQVARAAEPVVGRKTTATRVLASLPQLPSTAMQLTLIRGADTRWRLCTLSEELTDPDGQTTALF